MPGRVFPQSRWDTCGMARLPVLAASAAIGMVSGLRCMMAPAIVSRASGNGSLPLPPGPLHWLGSTASTNAFTALAVGELIADKTPQIPSRTTPGPLAARMISGGLCGAAICASKGERALTGAVVGALFAVGGAFLGYHLRRRAVRDGGFPDSVVALTEDAVAITGGLVTVAAIDVSR